MHVFYSIHLMEINCKGNAEVTDFSFFTLFLFFFYLVIGLILNKKAMSCTWWIFGCVQKMAWFFPQSPLDFFWNSIFESLLKMIFHVIDCIKMCQREHFLHANSRMNSFWIFFCNFTMGWETGKELKRWVLSGQQIRSRVTSYSTDKYSADLN